MTKHAQEDNEPRSGGRPGRRTTRGEEAVAELLALHETSPVVVDAATEAVGELPVVSPGIARAGAHARGGTSRRADVTAVRQILRSAAPSA